MTGLVSPFGSDAVQWKICVVTGWKISSDARQRQDRIDSGPVRIRAARGSPANRRRGGQRGGIRGECQVPVLDRARRDRGVGCGTRRTGRCLAGRAELQADGPAPSWFVRVRAFLAFHFPGAHRRECLDCPGLLIGEPGRRLFAIVPGPAAKQTHSAAKKTHSGILGRRLAELSHPRLRARSDGRSKCVLYLSEAAGRLARWRIPPRCGRTPIPAQGHRLLATAGPRPRHGQARARSASRPDAARRLGAFSEEGDLGGHPPAAERPDPLQVSHHLDPPPDHRRVHRVIVGIQPHVAARWSVLSCRRQKLAALRMTSRNEYACRLCARMPAFIGPAAWMPIGLFCCRRGRQRCSCDFRVVVPRSTGDKAAIPGAGEAHLDEQAAF